MSPLFDAPALVESADARRRRSIRSLENRIWALEQDLEDARSELDELRDAEECWPTMDILLAVYGAPGNWPVEAAA